MTSHNHSSAKKEDHTGCSHHGHHDHHKSGGEPEKGGKYDKVPEGYTGTVYTCPMHPEVRNPGPGSCPICGMGLEADTSTGTGDEGPNLELIDFTRRFWVGAVLTVPLLILAMSPYVGLGQIREFFGERTTLWIELLLGTPVILWSGWPFFERGYHSFRTMHLNMFSLIGMGVAAAYIFSIVAVIMPEIFPDGFRDAEGHVGVYFEAAAVIVTLILLGRYFEHIAKGRTSEAIKKLLQLQAKTARVIRDGEAVECVSLLTTKANDDVRPVHHRMPVLFGSLDEVDAWLDPSRAPETLSRLLEPAPAGSVCLRPMHTRLNHWSARGDGLRDADWTPGEAGVPALGAGAS
mgnify:CR=1 FL=1